MQSEGRDSGLTESILAHGSKNIKKEIATILLLKLQVQAWSISEVAQD